MAQMNLSVKQNHRHGEKTGSCQGVEGEGIEWEAAVSRCTLLYRTGKQQSPTYSTEN